MANFTIDKTSGHGDGTITIKPNLELTGRGPYRATVVVKSLHDSNLQRTVSCVKTFPLKKDVVTVSGSPSPNGEYNSIPMSESISIPATDYYVKFSASTNAKKINIPAVAFTYIAIGVNSMWLQPDGTLGNSQVDCRTAISNAVTIPGDPGSLSSYNLKIIVGFSENKSEFSRSTSFSIFLVGSDDSDTQLLFSGKVVQSAGFKTYGNITITEFSYPIIPATGGTVNPVLSYYQAWGWNGQTTGGGSITSGADISYTGVGVDTSSGAVTRESNESTSERNIEVTVSIEMNGKSATKDVICKQEGTKELYIRVPKNYVFFRDKNGGANTMRLDTNAKADDIMWMIDGKNSSEWCRIGLSDESEESQGVLLDIVVDENNDYEPRSGVILLFVKNEIQSGTHIIIVGQMGRGNNVLKIAGLVFDSIYNLSVGVSLIPRSYTQLRYYVISDNEWKTLGASSFVQIDKEQGGFNGIPDMVEVFLKVEENTGTTSRSLDIAIADKKGNLKEIDNNQEGSGDYIGLVSRQDKYFVEKEGRNISIGFRSNLTNAEVKDFPYKILEGGDWIKFNRISSNGGMFNYTFTVQENNTAYDREGKIAIGYGTNILPIIITVTQSGH